jgi:uncharacterized membrane protein YuzA (DUF378 family)
MENKIEKIGFLSLTFFNFILGIEIVLIRLFGFSLVALLSSPIIRRVFTLVLGISAIVCSIILAVKTFRR